jgi:SAM-dependent methyltransferase
LNAAAVEWVGIDVSEGMVRELSRMVPADRARVAVADACHLPFATASFDKVLCSGVLMHLQDEVAGLQEIRRVLRPGGLFVGTLNNGFSPFAVPVRVHNARKKGFVQRFHLPNRYFRLLRELGLQVGRVRGDAILSSVSLSLGKLSFPPKVVFPAFKAFDEWAAPRLPWLAYEVWFSAKKIGTSWALEP